MIHIINKMRDSLKIEELKFRYHDKDMIPAQTYVTPYGEIYITFKKTDGTFINIHSSDVKKYIKNS
jgi:hypothetical protein